MPKNAIIIISYLNNILTDVLKLRHDVALWQNWP